MNFIQTFYIAPDKDPFRYPFGWAAPECHLMSPYFLIINFFINFANKSETIFYVIKTLFAMYKKFIEKSVSCLMLYLTLCLIFANCSQLAKKVESNDVTIEANGLREIAVIKNISNSQKINLSTIATDITYCLLETDKKCLVTPYMSIYCTKDYIITIGEVGSMRAACYVFDRKTGEFVRQISRMGQGPNDYLEVLKNFWDEKNEQICVWSPPNFVFYNIDGTISHKINRTENPYFSESAISIDNYYVRYFTNSFGNQTKRIIFLDRTGALIDSIPNYRTWKMINPKDYYPIGEVKFHIFRNELYYMELFCDTLYHIVDFKLQPRYVFNTMRHTLPYQEAHSGIGRYDLLAPIRGEELVDLCAKYFIIDKILEDTNHLYFTFDYQTKRYPAIYNKKEDILQILPPISIPLPSRNSIIPLYGFENDLDGGLPFWPQQMISDREMMCVYTAEELLELDASKISDEKLKSLLNNLREDDNPVVAIVTLKD